jgi:RimJ/RimL family protein N-acetyltransferase
MSENVKSMGKDTREKSRPITLKRIGPESAPIVQKIFEASPEYFRLVDGSEVLPHFALKEIKDEPKKKSPTYEKFFLLILEDGKPVGVVDFHKDHPVQGSTYLGLFLLVERVHGSGVGRAAYQVAEEYARSELGAHKILIGVSEKNDVTDFWKKMGYEYNGQSYIWKGEKWDSLVVELEKDL